MCKGEVHSGKVAYSLELYSGVVDYILELHPRMVDFRGKQDCDVDHVLCLVAQLCLMLCDPRDCSPPGSSVRWDFPGKNTGVGCHALLQGIFPTQGSNPGLPHCRWILLPSEPPGKPDIKHNCPTKKKLEGLWKTLCAAPQCVTIFHPQVTRTNTVLCLNLHF